MTAASSSPAHAFVGREAECLCLQELIQQAQNGAGGVAIISGEAGIGKTRLAEELIDRARLAGFEACWGTCYADEGAPAFRPWSQILGASTQGAAGEPPSLAAQPAADIASATEARYQLFERIADYLRAAARHKPLLLVLDDLHWADAPSLLLFGFLARALADARIVLVGTLRDDEGEPSAPLAQLLGALARLPHARRLTLAGLSRTEVAELAAAVAPSGQRSLTADALHAATEGNPFFVCEFVRFQLSGAAAAGLPLTPAVHDVVRLRLARLPLPAQRTLTAAAIIGREFSVVVLSRLVEGSEAALLDALADAEESRLLVAVEPQRQGSVERYRFAHALVREVLYEQIPHARRTLLHRQVALALEDVYADDAERLAELAYHFSKAAAAGVATQALHYARRAAERSLRQYAYEEAARFAALALDVLPLAAPRDREQRIALLCALADAHDCAGDLVAALANYERAATLARELLHDAEQRLPYRPSEPARLLAEIALGMGHAASLSGHARGAVTVLLAEASRALGDDDRSALHARVLARLSEELLYAGEPLRGRELSAIAVDVARQSGDRATLAAALHSRCYALWGPDDRRAQRVAIDEMLQLAQQTGDDERALLALEWLITNQAVEGDMPAMHAAVAEYARRAEALRRPIHQARALRFAAMEALHAEPLETAERYARQALALRRRANDPDAIVLYGMQIFVVRWLQGRLAELERDTRYVASLFPNILAYRASLLLLLSETGHEEEARALFASVIDDEFPTAQREASWLTACAYLAETCARLGDAQRALALYEQLRPYDGLNVTVSTALVCLGPVSRYLGLLAATAISHPPAHRYASQQAASRHFEAALATCQRMGHRIALACTQLDYATLLLSPAVKRQAAPDASTAEARARALLDAAGITARELGLTALSARIESVQAALAPPARPRAALPDGLTEREVEILRLLVAGRSNVEIARELVLARPTVQNHLSNIYRKIDATGRAEAVAYAFRNGLIPATP